MPDLSRQSQQPGNRPALVLVDLSVAFTDPGCPLGSACDDVVAVNALLLAEFRRRALPVFFTTVCYREAAQARIFRQRIPDLNLLAAESPEVAIDQRVAPLDGEPVIEKHHASSFFGTTLATQLTAAGADSVVVTGLTTSGCVRATAVDSLQYDFATFVVSDAVGDRNPAAHAANLHDLDAKYADVLDHRALLALLPDPCMIATT